MIKLVAFDWNGTLLSDTYAAVKADNLALKKLKVKRTVKLKEFQKHFQIPIIDYWKGLKMDSGFYKKDMFTLEHVFHDFYEPLADKSRTRSGTKETLSWLNKNNINAVIYSNHIKPKISRQLERLNIAEYITDIMAREQRDSSLLHGRGKGEKLAAYVKSKKLKPHEVISIGDTEEEIEIGKKLGYIAIGITGGYNSTARLKKHSPDYLIHNMKELTGIIKKLNK
jgi:phosphoglycolate phosphatase-like HAD superfamily hydrolase